MGLGSLPVNFINIFMMRLGDRTARSGLGNPSFCLGLGSYSAFFMPNVILVVVVVVAVAICCCHTQP